MSVPAYGPPDARIMIVGEAPGENEVLKGRPFVGYSGQLLETMLAEAGISMRECYLTNVCRERPPGNDMSLWMPATLKAQGELGGTDVNGRIVHRSVALGHYELEKEIALVQPDLILALGSTALWSLTNLTGISSWRGSTLRYTSDVHSCIVVPTYHPAAVLRQWSTRGTVVHDFTRAHDALLNGIRKPVWNFTVRPTMWQVQTCLRRLLELADSGPLTIANDIETSCGHMTCMGIAWTKTDALCIPFTCVEKPEGYWSLDDEAHIVYALSKLLLHPNVTVVGQNYIYDAQYIYRYWHFFPRRVRDTMLAQHTLFPRLPKSLDFIASMYCDYYVYWKDDGKDWRGDGDQDKYWRYNCEDCVRTLECDEELQTLVDAMGLREPHDFQMRMWPKVLAMMNRGILVDKAAHAQMRTQLLAHADKCQREINYMVGHDLNPRSPKQMQGFFYEELGLPKQIKRGKDGGVSCDDEALARIAEKEPMVRPIVSRVAECRSCETVAANALKVGALGPDGRMRSSFNIGGTGTFRLSSSTDAFGSGMNLQNITSGDEEEE